MHLQLAGLPLGVEILFEAFQRFVGQAPLLAVIDEVMRAVVRDPDADQAARDQLVEVAGKRPVQHLPESAPARH